MREWAANARKMMPPTIEIVLKMEMAGRSKERKKREHMG
jgi:hypothetical protein